MSIDQKALAIAAKAFVDYFDRNGKYDEYEMSQAVIEAYEAAKSEGQPVEETLLEEACLATCYKIADGEKLKRCTIACNTCKNELRPYLPAITSILGKPKRESSDDDINVVSKWQPIETAPTNESVLIFIPNAEHYGAGVYRGLQVDMGTGRHWQVSGLHMGRDCSHDQQPTHWMQLPSTIDIEDGGSNAKI